MMETSYSVNNRPPIKEIALAVALLVFGVLGIILGAVMAANKVGGDRAHGNLVHLPLMLQFCPLLCSLFVVSSTAFDFCFFGFEAVYVFHLKGLF